MTPKQQKLYNDYLSVASFEACEIAENASEFELADTYAPQVLREAVLKYDPSRDGEFQHFAVRHIRKRLRKLLNQSSNPTFRQWGMTEIQMENFYSSGEEVLQDEFNAILRDAGFDNL